MRLARALGGLEVEPAEPEQRQGKTSAIDQGMMQELLAGRSRLL